MITAHPGERPARPRHEVWRLAASLAATLAALAVVLHSPAVAAALAPLSMHTAALTAEMLAWMNIPVTREFAVLAHPGGFSYEIYYACTALCPAVLLAALVLPARTSLRSRLLAVVVGGGLMLVLNQLRLVNLFYLGVYHPQAFAVAHAWLWQGVLVAVIAGYWLAWLRLARR